MGIPQIREPRSGVHILVLFGGGDAGGLYIGADGKIHRLPPFDPGVIEALVELDGLAAQGAHEEAGSLAQKVVPQLHEALDRHVGGSLEG